MPSDVNSNAVKIGWPRPGIAELRLNHPERLNAVDETTVGALNRALDEVGASAAARVVLLAGEGRAFCAGANYKRHVAGDRSFEQKQAYLKLLLDGCERLRKFRLPIVVAVQGFAVGIGLEMALNCDFIIASETAEFGFPEIGIATFVGGGVTVTLPRVIGLARARRMIILGERLKGPDALAAGLVVRCVPDRDLQAEALAFAEALARQAPVSVALAKQLLNATGEMDRARKAEYDSIVACMRTEDWHEGVRAFSEKRPPVYRGR